MNVATQFTLNFKDIVNEEVALEGLEGITLELLWKRIEKRISRSLTKLIYSRLWSCALQNVEISLFELPEPRPTIELFNRTDFVCDSGLLRDPVDYLDGPYEYHPVKDDRGSCKDYATRQPLPKDTLTDSSLDDVMSKYGNRLVLVASAKERWKALVPHMPEKSVEQLSPINYCILELIGKSRENGQASIGKSNLLKVLNNAQLFYTRKLLCKIDFIAQVQVYIKIEGSKYMKPYILKLKRFHVPALYLTPQQGKFVDLISHLKTKPNFTDTVKNLKKLSLPLPVYTKKKRKFATFLTREIAQPSEGEPPKKKVRNKEHPDELIKLIVDSDYESDSDTEVDVVPKPCEHMVGVNLYRQAYELIVSAGTRGLSAMEFRQALGVGFYSSRHILKWFREKNIVKEYFEEQGRQKMGRYAIEITTIMDDIKTEKEKLVQYFMETFIKAENVSLDEASTSTTPFQSMEDSSDVLNQTDEINNTSYEFKANVSEVDLNEPGSIYKDLIDSKKRTSIRQLKFVNAILKITREKRVIAGFRTLNTLAATEINTPCMDSKNFSSFLYKLAKDCQIKIYDLKWPTKRITKSTLIVCAPDVKLDDPVIKEKYNEICIRCNVSSDLAESKELLHLATSKDVVTKGEKCKPNYRDRVLDSIEKGHYMPSLSLQRYKRIQKVHEFIFELVYSGVLETTSTSTPPGYVSMANLIGHMPVRLVLGQFSRLTLVKLNNFTITADMLDVKLKDTPPALHSILSSKTFRVTVFDTINILATFGLVQICLPLQITEDHYHVGLFRYIFYVNHKASIIDTRGEWPREDVDVETLKQVFYLETQQDVKMYWKTVNEIAVNTKVAKHAKRWSLPAMKVIPEKEAPRRDTGQIFGDGAGACGFDSVYHIEQPKYWEKMTTEMLNKDNVKFLPRPKKAKTNPLKKKPATLKTKVATKNTIKTRNRSVKAIKREPVVKWSSWEDNILMLVRTALAILSPNEQPGSIAIRNTVSKLLINNSLKQAGPCHKRLQTLENQVAFCVKKECLLKEMKRQKGLISKYEDLFTRLRYKHAQSEPNYIREGELVCLELVFLLYKISKSESFLERSTPCVATSLHDFYSRFEIKTAAIDKRTYTLYHLEQVPPAELQALREAVLMALTSGEDIEVPIETTRNIFNCLSSYNESYLREAVEMLRKTGVIAIKEKYLHAQLNNFSLQDLIRVTSSYMKAMSAYKLSAAYRRRQTGRLNTSFVDDIVEIVKNSDLSGKVRGSAETNCVSFELHAMNAIDIVTVTKPSVVEISRDGNSKDEERNAEEATKSVVNAGYVELRKKAPFASLTELYDVPDFSSLFQTLIETNMVRQAKGAPPRTDKIINHLKSVGQDGATLKDLQKIWTSDTKSLIRKLDRLEKENFITHVGFLDNIVVLSEFAHHWCIKIGDVSLIPCPWLTGDFIINKSFFIKWCATIVNKVFEYPGIAISKLALEHFDVLAPRCVQQCCEFLQALKCVTLNYVDTKDVDLFSDDHAVVELIEYCKFGATENLVIFPVTNMLTKFSYFKSLILDDK